MKNDRVATTEDRILSKEARIITKEDRMTTKEERIITKASRMITKEERMNSVGVTPHSHRSSTSSKLTVTPTGLLFRHPRAAATDRSPLRDSPAIDRANVQTAVEG